MGKSVGLAVAGVKQSLLLGRYLSVFVSDDGGLFSCCHDGVVQLVFWCFSRCYVVMKSQGSSLGEMSGFSYLTREHGRGWYGDKKLGRMK